RAAHARAVGAVLFAGGAAAVRAGAIVDPGDRRRSAAVRVQAPGRVCRGGIVAAGDDELSWLAAVPAAAECRDAGADGRHVGVAGGGADLRGDVRGGAV